MSVLKGQRTYLRGRSVRRSATARLHVESLESRNLPSGLAALADLAPLLNQAGIAAGKVGVEGSNSQAAPQDLGTLTPSDLAGGVAVIGGFHSEAADFYQFQVTEARDFVISLSDLSSAQGMPAGNWLTATDATTGQPFYLASWGATASASSQINPNGQILVSARLQPGTVYGIQTANWSANALYALHFGYPDEAPESPRPLSLDAAAAIRLRFVNNGAGLPPGAAPLASAPASSVNAPNTAGSTVIPAILAAFGDGTQVIPASNNIVSGAANNAVAPGSSNIPGGVYVALGAGSVGGFALTNPGNASSSPDLYDRIYGQAPALALGDRLMGLAILSQIGTASNVDVTDPSAGASTNRQNPPGWWQNLPRIRGRDAVPPSAIDRTAGVLKADASPETEEYDLFLPDGFE